MENYSEINFKNLVIDGINFGNSTLYIEFECGDAEQAPYTKRTLVGDAFSYSKTSPEFFGDGYEGSIKINNTTETLLDEFVSKF